MRSTGADWKSFNAAQKQVRMDMVRLYGNERRLVPPKSPLDTAGPEGISILCVFYFQVGTFYVWLFVCLCYYKFGNSACPVYLQNQYKKLQVAIASDVKNADQPQKLHCRFLKRFI